MPERTHESDMEQIRIISQSIGAAVGDALAHKMPTVIEEKIDVPGPLKWAAGICAAVMTAIIIGMGAWMVSTLNDLQITVTEIKGQIANQGGTSNNEIQYLKERVSQLEAYHRDGGK